MLPKIAFARKLRREATAPEQKLWRAIRAAWPERHWRKQVPIGRYFADFALHAERLIVEVDGGQHSERGEYDAARTAFFHSRSYRVLRFWSNEVMENTSGVIEAIALHVPAVDPHPNPSPQGGGA